MARVNDSMLNEFSLKSKKVMLTALKTLPFDKGGKGDFALSIQHTQERFHATTQRRNEGQ